MTGAKHLETLIALDNLDKQIFLWIYGQIDTVKAIKIYDQKICRKIQVDTLIDRSMQNVEKILNMGVGIQFSLHGMFLLSYSI